MLIESLEYLTNDFQFDLYAKFWSSPFHAFFPDRKWWPRNREWRPFGVDWVPLVIRSLHRKKLGSSNAFPVPDGTIGSLLHLCHVLDYVFSIFHFCEVVNCKLLSLWIGSGYINLCTFVHTIKVTDHHCDGAKVVPCELISFEYTHQHITGNVDMSRFVRSIYCDYGRAVTRVWWATQTWNWHVVRLWLGAPTTT